MLQINGDSITVTDTLKLSSDISALYLNRKFSDVVLIVEDQRLPAHKVILAARSEYFETLLYNDPHQVSQTEVVLHGTTSESFQIFLKYIYTGSITLEVSKANLFVEVFGLAHQCSFKELATSLNKHVDGLVNPKNVYNVLNIASLYDMDGLREVCLKMFESHPKELLTSDSLKNLSQTSMIKLLQRDTFVLPEHDIFILASKWRTSNEDVDDLVLGCVRLTQMSTAEIVTEVWPSKLFACEKLFEALSEIVGGGSKTSRCRGQLLLDVNLASLELKSKVVSGRNTSLLLTGNRDVMKFAENGIGDRNGITIELGNNYLINHIFTRLYDNDMRFYMYYVEVSCDNYKWKKVIDYSKYACRSHQYLYFAPEIAKYVRVVGTHNSVNLTSTANFHLIFFEAYYKSTLPKVVNTIIRPITNVATVDKHAVVIEGHRGEVLINGDFKNYNHSVGFCGHFIGSGSITVQLAQPYLVSSLKLLLWDFEERSFRYYIETSVNKIDWVIAVDHRNKDSKSWQQSTFAERAAVFIRIIGTHSSHTNAKGQSGLQCIHLECPANST